MSGQIGDAEKIKLVWGKDNVEKIKARIVLMEKCKQLPAQTRAELVAVLYGYTVTEVPDLVLEYVRETMPGFADQPMPRLFNIWYQGIINREKFDLKQALIKMGVVKQ